MITYRDLKPDNQDQVIALYQAVGWTYYAIVPDDLMRALHNSAYVISAYHHDQLVGLIRGLSDGVSVHFIQDLLVHPEHQRCGIGRTLLNKAMALYANVYKHILLTDNEIFQKRIYESLEFKNLNLIEPKLNVYIKLSDDESYIRQ